MKIHNIDNFNINFKQIPKIEEKNLRPNQDNNTDCFKNSFDNILYSENERYHGLKVVVFKKPITPSDAILSLAYSKDKNIQEALFYKLHMMDELEEMAADISTDRFLRDLKVTKLVGIGAFALVFETENGDILKLTGSNHFPNNRKPDFFDIPIKKQGKICRTHYYIEDKVSQKDITQEEIQELIKQIEESGYTLKDYKYTSTAYGEQNKIKTEQFGKTADGKLYLIDPGCALAPEKPLIDIKSIKEKIKKIFRI